MSILGVCMRHGRVHTAGHVHPNGKDGGNMEAYGAYVDAQFAKLGNSDTYKYSVKLDTYGVLMDAKPHTMIVDRDGLEDIYRAVKASQRRMWAAAAEEEGAE